MMTKGLCEARGARKGEVPGCLFVYFPMEGSTVLIRQVYHASGKLEMGSDWLNTALKQKQKQKQKQKTKNWGAGFSPWT